IILTLSVPGKITQGPLSIFPLQFTVLIIGNKQNEGRVRVDFLKLFYNRGRGPLPSRFTPWFNRPEGAHGWKELSIQIDNIRVLVQGQFAEFRGRTEQAFPL